MDGMSSCYLRLLEAVLLANGVTKHELPMALLHPLDFRPAHRAPELSVDERSHYYIFPRDVYGSWDNYTGVVVNWEATRGRNVRALIYQGLNDHPVLILPDHYYLPWHPKYGREHGWMQVMMVLGSYGVDLELLDIHATRSSDFRRRWHCEDSVLDQAIVKIGGVIYQDDWREMWDMTFQRVMHSSQQLLPIDVPGLREEARRWGQDFSCDRYSVLEAALQVVVPPTIYLYLALTDSNSPLSKRLPRRSFLHLYEATQRSYKLIKRAERRALSSGVSNPDPLAAGGLASFLDALDALAEDLSAVVV